MEHAIQVLKEEKYKLMAHIRTIERNSDDLMCNLSTGREQKRLDEVDAAIIFIQTHTSSQTSETS